MNGVGDEQEVDLSAESIWFIEFIYTVFSVITHEVFDEPLVPRHMCF